MGLRTFAVLGLALVGGCSSSGGGGTSSGSSATTGSSGTTGAVTGTSAGAASGTSASGSSSSSSTTAGASSTTSGAASTSGGRSSSTGRATSSGTVGSSGSSGTTGGVAGRESWAWLYANWQTSLTTIASNRASFTHISPTFYTVNYAYQSGVAAYANCTTNGSNACTDQGTNDFDGLTTQQVTGQVADAGLATVPIIFGGASNQGVDTGVQNLLNDASDAGEAFITAMVGEAVANGYQGYNLDWEVGSGVDDTYADKFVTFVNQFKAAMAPYGMSLSADVIGSNVEGTWCSGNNGYLDFAKLSGSSIDRLIIEDYTSSYSRPSMGSPTSCQTTALNPSQPVLCPLNDAGTDVTAVGLFDFMCSNLPAGMVVIGLDSNSQATNPIAGQVFAGMEAYGFSRVAVWPQIEGAYPFLSAQGLVAPQSDWYSMLAAFLAY